MQSKIDEVVLLESLKTTKVNEISVDVAYEP